MGVLGENISYIPLFNLFYINYLQTIRPSEMFLYFKHTHIHTHFSLIKTNENNCRILLDINHI